MKAPAPRGAKIHRLIWVLRLKLVGYVAFLITSKVLDVRRRGATTEAYGVIHRKPAPAKAGGGAIEGNAADDALMVNQGGGN
jgi:hypothetical protein